MNDYIKAVVEYNSGKLHGTGIEAIIKCLILESIKDYIQPRLRNAGKRNKNTRDLLKNRLRYEAKLFLLSEDCKFMCEVINWNYNYIKNMIEEVENEYKAL